jgi:hypothetical protein
VLASNRATAADAGTVDVRGDLTVTRIGLGAMRRNRPRHLGRSARPKRGPRCAPLSRRAWGHFIDIADSAIEPEA